MKRKLATVVGILAMMLAMSVGAPAATSTFDAVPVDPDTRRNVLLARTVAVKPW